MARVTPEEYAAKQAQRLKSSTEDIRRGVSRVSQAPGESAVRQQDRLLQSFQEAVSSGRWAAATRAVSLQEWQDATISKGIGRIAAGIDAAQPRQVQMAQRLLSAVDTAAGKARGMPSLTLDDRIARSASFIRDMAAQKGKIKTG